MPNASTTEQISSADTSGSPIGLAYGFVWATGKRLVYNTRQNTGNSLIDFTRVGGWALGEGEWDGNAGLWINDQLIWQTENDDLTQFHFHRGSDAVIGSGLTPASTGPDQGVDAFYSSFPAGVQPLAYNRIANYFISRKQGVVGGTGKENDASQWTDIAPIGLWRSRRVRLFADNGVQTGYAFVTNPAWHIVDAILSRKIKPDYNIDAINGPTPLTAAEAARFDWGSIVESAQYFDSLLTNGRRRFTGNYCFTSAATLNAILEQMLLVCRSHMHEYAGKVYLVCDRPRPSTFIVSRSNMLSMAPNDQALHTSGNRFIGKFRDLLIPAAATIASITGGGLVTTEAGHPFQIGDLTVIGGEGAPWDGYWTVLSVPPATLDASGNVVPVFTLTLVAKGSNYATNAPAGGSIGLIYSRFKERSPEFQHNANQLARGAVGLGIARQKKKVSQTMDLSVLTYDQAARIMMYERDRVLGPDVTPYVSPVAMLVKVPYFAEDVNGNLVAAQKPGDRITIDNTASVPYAGEYEILDITIIPCKADAANDNGTIGKTAASGSGESQLQLIPYNPSRFYDSSSQAAAGWVDVPGSDPGNEAGYTGGGTAGGGSFAFLTGAVASGSAFALPSVGFPPANVLAWASPQGYLPYVPPDPGAGPFAGPMHTVALCGVDLSSLRAILQYTDGNGNYWGGDVNYAALAWNNGTGIRVVTVGSLTYVIITLANGEIICFGCGVVADGGTFALPAGFTTNQMFAFSSPFTDNSIVDAQNNEALDGAHGFSSWIDGTPPTTVHLQYASPPSTNGGATPDPWTGSVQVLVFAWQNNSGQVALESVAGGLWMTVPDTASTVLGVGLVRLSHGQTLPVPAVASSSTSLQAIPSPRSVAPSASGNPAADAAINALCANGVAACYLDPTNTLNMSWNAIYPASEDGVASTWHGDAMVFALFWGALASTGLVTPAITISPLAGVVRGPTGYLQFTALVVGESSPSVIWSVDGVPGGNSAVGMIDGNGMYTAPTVLGVHTITAVSVADGSLIATAPVTAYSDPTPIRREVSGPPVNSSSS